MNFQRMKERRDIVCQRVREERLVVIDKKDYDNLADRFSTKAKLMPRHATSFPKQLYTHGKHIGAFEIIYHPDLPVDFILFFFFSDA